MIEDCLKLTSYFGERDLASSSAEPGAGKRRFLADALSEIYARHELRTSLVMRGVEGFGIKHHLRTDRLLTLSEDLPLVSVAVDTRARVERALAEVERLRFEGLVTLERARMVTEPVGRIELPPELEQASKLTVYVGRHERSGGRLAYEAIVDLLRRHGIAGATVLLGVDGTAHGQRQRARFFAANAQVPLMVIAVGEGARVVQVLPELGEILSRPLITLERIRVCKRDGRVISPPQPLPDSDPSGLGVWQKLMVYTAEQDRTHGHSLHHRLIRVLRGAGASGATTLRGIWGYSHGDRPHGDSFWQLRRRLPIVTIIVDTPDRARRWFDLIDEVTGDTGLVTSEMVPAFRATGPDLRRGGLLLARLGG